MTNKTPTPQELNELNELRKELQIKVGTDQMSVEQARAIYKKAKENIYQDNQQQDLKL